MTLHKVASVAEDSAFDHRVVDLRRVVRVVSGGRRFRFRATVVVGDKKGMVGLGIAKARDVQQAISKAQEAAKKNFVRILLTEGTVPHVQQSRYRGSTVLVKPAPEGSGIIAGGPIRAVALLAGIRDVSAKIMGSRNRVNVVKATLKALQEMKTDDSRNRSQATREGGTS